MNAGFRRSFSRFAFSRYAPPLYLRRASAAHFSSFSKLNSSGFNFRRIDKQM